MSVFDAAPGRAETTAWSRWSAVALAAFGLSAALVAAVVYRAIGEVGGENSYALLADAYLHGRFDSPACFDNDCALFLGKIFVIFPPAPALVMTPFVALFGPNATGFMVVSIVLTTLTAWAWWRIADRAGLERDARLWLTLAFVFGTPAIYVTLRGDAVWFFAQVVALALVSWAILAALDRRLVLAGVLIGLAFLSRQMAVFLAPFLFALARPKGARLIEFDRTFFADCLRLGAPILACVVAYCAYNFVRFGAPLETGYKYLADFAGEGQRGFINYRILDLGLFSKDYLLFNLVHMFLQGFHLDFGGRHMTDVVGMDPMGSSILAASPFVLFAFYARPDMKMLVGLPVIAIVCGITLFYHSNGYSQHNVQRYALDWLPVLYVLMLPAFAGASEKAAERLKAFKLLATYAIGLNLAAVAFVAMTKGVA